MIRFLFLSVLTLAQQEVFALNLDLEGLVGAVSVDDGVWQRIDLRPRLRFGALEASLDLELFIDGEGRIRDRGWDFSSRRRGLESILRKIHYVRYGVSEDRDRRFYFQVGALDRLTLGNGLIVSDYRNTFGSPGLKRTGLDLQLRGFLWESLAIRGFVNDAMDLLDRGSPLVGGRASAVSWGGLEVGATLALDLDQLSALPDSVRAGAEDDAYGAYGVDVAYPVLQGRGVFVSLYGGIARPVATDKKGTGFHGPGIRLVAGRLSARAEARFVRGAFEPDHFDALYEQARAHVAGDGSLVTREAGVADVDLNGFLANIELRDFGVLGGEVAYQYLIGNGSNDRFLRATLTIKPGFLGPLRHVSLSEAYLEKRDRAASPGGFFEVNGDTRFGYRVGLRPAGKVSVIWNMEFSYVPNGSGGFERQRTLGLQTVFGL